MCGQSVEQPQFVEQPKDVEQAQDVEQAKDVEQATRCGTEERSAMLDACSLRGPERRLRDAGLFASSDIFTWGRTVLVGGRRVILGANAVDEY